MVTKKTVLLVCQDDNLRVALIEQLQSYSEFQVIESSGAIKLIQISEKLNFETVRNAFILISDGADTTSKL